MITKIKKMMALLVFLTILKTNVTAQVTTLGNGFPGVATDYSGWNATRLFPFTIAHKGNFPINFQTNGVQRMTIMNTTGFVGIGTPLPSSPLHIMGSGFQNGQGWRRGITLSNEAALTWDGGPGSSFFMAHPSSSPSGNFYAGSATCLIPRAA